MVSDPLFFPQATVNPYAWSRVATVVYLDSPAGVGLSYSDTVSDYTTNDTATAADVETFLRRFLEQYPEYLDNELYIAGTWAVVVRSRLPCGHVWGRCSVQYVAANVRIHPVLALYSHPIDQQD